MFKTSVIAVKTLKDLETHKIVTSFYSNTQSQANEQAHICLEGMTYAFGGFTHWPENTTFYVEPKGFI